MTFDEVKDRVGETAHIAGEKTEKFVCRQKTRFDLTLAKNELDSLYRELGAACYKAGKAGEEPDTSALTAKITDKLREIASLKETIARLK